MFQFQCSVFQNRSYKDFLGNAPPQVSHDLVELDQEDDDEQDIVMTDTADINYDFIRTG